ncbi:hypothetical protein IAU60_006562 [Kwoniella sp. DSM 27419]
MAQTTSPLLLNSSFAQYDYFSAASRAPTFKLDLTASPSSPASTSSHRFLATPELGRSYLPSTRQSDLHSSGGLQLASPQFVASPKLGSDKSLNPKRRSVQLGETAAVNWARPLRVEQEASSSMRIFGASSQRDRRLNRYPAPSPSSSDDEPLTPSPVTPSADDSAAVLTRAWSVFSSAKGLGVSGVAEWDPPVTPMRELSLNPLSDSVFEPLEYSPATSAITPPKRPVALTRTEPVQKPVTGIPRSQTLAQVAPLPSPSNLNLLVTSQSLNSFSSPSTLEELRNLRQAASLLESEAKKVNKPNVAGLAERKIKRKAVPSLVDEDRMEARESTAVADAAPVDQLAGSFGASFGSGRQGPPSTSSPASVTTPSSSGPTAPCSPTSSASSSPGSYFAKLARRSSLIETVHVPRQLPGTGNANSIFDNHRQLYQNHLASQSVMEISPRSNSFGSSFRISKKGKVIKPIVIPPRTSSTTSPPRSGSIPSLSDGSAATTASCGSSVDERPLTPTSTSLSASQRDHFLSSVENAFKQLETERAELQKTSGKHKRGISRFLGK